LLGQDSREKPTELEIMEPRRKHVRSRTIAIGFALLVLYVVWTSWRIWTYDGSTGRWADAAIVLGASNWGDKPSPVFVERIRHGVSLYKQGRVRKLIMSGGIGKGEDISLAETARGYATAQGVPASDIVMEPHSRITRENLVYSLAIAGKHNLGSFLIVSDPLHMFRSMRMARDLGMNAWPSATPTSLYISGKKRFWFLRRETYFYIQYVAVTRFIPVRPLSEAVGDSTPRRSLASN